MVPRRPSMAVHALHARRDKLAQDAHPRYGAVPPVAEEVDRRPLRSHAYAAVHKYPLLRGAVADERRYPHEARKSG